MLTVLRDVLNVACLATPHSRLRYYINLTTGDTLAVSVFLDDGRFLQVKASEFVDLEVIYQRGLEAWKLHRELAPRPLAFACRPPWSIIVSEGVSHRALRRNDVLGRRWLGSGAMAPHICRYFATSRSADRASQSRSSLLPAVARHFHATPLAPLASAWTDLAGSAGFAVLPRRSQHGDFVLNNLAVANDRLVVFDWEDYGVVDIPGLDVVTLCLSLLDQEVDALRALADPESAIGSQLEPFVARAAAAQGIEVAILRRFVPFYLLLFLYLKRSYGHEVQDRIDKLLRALGPPKSSCAPHLTAPDERQLRHRPADTGG